MNIQTKIDSGKQLDEKIIFAINDNAGNPIGEPTGKMITDSDNISFVYLFEVEGESGYRHIYFNENVWPLMVELMVKDLDPVLSWQNEMIPLIGFKDELTMLVYNIEGNDNYGEAFSSAVETAFSSILQSVE